MATAAIQTNGAAPAPEQKTEQKPEKKLSIYAIADELLTLDALLEETQGEVTPEIEAWMAEYGEKLAGKVDNIGRYAANLQGRAAIAKAEAKAFEDEVDRLKTRARVAENKVKSLKTLLGNVMVKTGRDKLEGDVFEAAIQKNGGKRPLTVLVAPTSLPPQFIIPQAPKVNEDAIRASTHTEAQEDGTVLVFHDYPLRHTRHSAPDAPDYERVAIARIENPGFHVRIR